MPSPARHRRTRVALVGVGSAATRAHLPVLGDAARCGTVELVGICDRDPERIESAVADHPGAAGFDDNVAMLEAVAPDLLVIATPPSAHLDEIAAAMSRGVHVLCEKPLGLSSADVARLRQLAAAHPELALATVAQYRHAPAWMAISRAAAGAVGGSEEFSLRVVVERPGTDPLSAGGWRAEAEREGGILGDHAVHYLSMIRLLDPSATVTGCHRHGPGGRETATVDLRVGSAGSARIEVSYAGEQRRNLITMERPRQCLVVSWDGTTLQLLHAGTASGQRAVSSLSDRSFVNQLYAPMYRTVTTSLGSAVWRQDETRHTLDVAAMLAAARELAR